MSYNAYPSVNPDNMSRLPFLKGKVVHLFEEGTKIHAGVLFKISEADYYKATSRLKGTSEEEIKSTDIVYIMPGSKIPHFKLKDHIKKIGAKVTYNIDQATFFIGTSRIEQSTNLDRKPASLLYHNAIAEYAINPNLAMAVVQEHEEAYKNLVASISDIDVLVDREANKSLGDDKGLAVDYFSDSDCFYITPAGCDIIYHSILKKAPIVSEDFIIEKIMPTIVIDADIYASVRPMLGSSDTKDNLTGAEIISNSDIEKSEYYIWKLAHEYSTRLDTQYKNIRLFIQKSNWWELARMNEEEFLEYFVGKNKMTPEIFAELSAVMAEDVAKIASNNVFSIILVPNTKYQKYADPGLKFEFNIPGEKEIEEEINEEELEQM